MERQEKKQTTDYYTNVLSCCVTSNGGRVITQGKGAWIYDRGPPLLFIIFRWYFLRSFSIQ